MPENGNRLFETIPFNTVVDRMKKGLIEVPDKNEKGHLLFFHLSPNDLLYVPSEKENIHTIDWENLNEELLKRIYKMVSCTGNQCFFIRQEVATSIVNKVEFSSLNKMEKTLEGLMIKEKCIKLNINRSGEIKPVITNSL